MVYEFDFATGNWTLETGETPPTATGSVSTDRLTLRPWPTVATRDAAADRRVTPNPLAGFPVSQTLPGD
jgi:hypothetical protein